MKVSELIEILQDCLEECGDKDVVIYAERAEVQMSCYGVSEEYTPDKSTVIEIFGDASYG